MKRIINILLFLGFLQTASYAQKVTIGPKVGLNLSSLSNEPNTEALTGFQAGGFFIYSIVEHFGVSADVFYSQQGAKSSVTDDKFHLNYIQIPVLANIFFNSYGDDFRPKIVFGPSLGLLASVKGPGLEKNDFKSSDFGGVVGLGFNYKVGEKKWLNVDARYGMGFSSVFENANSFNDDVKNNYFSLTVGLGFGVNEE